MPDQLGPNLKVVEKIDLAYFDLEIAITNMNRRQTEIRLQLTANTMANR